ncbi:hypothetical protein TI05_08765 [Achromatium sp. WMS3]|nr:hypothetical protein TI05_08765 [Achromatium sp. WMS3]
MISIVEVKNCICNNPNNWEIPFMEFVDDFRGHKYINLEEPFKISNDKFDALLASTIEYLCHEQRINTPEWVIKVPACTKPWFVAGIESLKAITLVESPLEFRIRKIFVLENFLDRV